MTRHRRSIMTHGRAVLVRVAAACIAVVMLVGVLRGGASYVYCPTMQMVTDAPCCAGDRRAHHDEDAAIVQLRSRDCCEQHVLARLPAAGATSAAPHVVPAALVTVLAAPTADPRQSGPSTRVRFDHEGRAGPMAMVRHCAELMVSLS